MTLSLEEYRELIALDEPFRPPPPLSDADLEAAVDEMLAVVEQEQSAPSGMEAKRRQLRAALTVRAPGPLPAATAGTLDALLRAELTERGMVTADELPRIAERWPNAFGPAGFVTALWQGDITRLQVDAIVNAANDQLLGCFVPFHGCIDNAIHDAAGPRLREDCATIMNAQGVVEPVGDAKATRAYNLPSRFVLHTVGPQLPEGRGVATPAESEQLAACYRSCLDLATELPEVRTVAFCSISTGLFGFPKRAAAIVALQTVVDWLSRHPGALELVVFDLFSADDVAVYQELLAG